MLPFLIGAAKIIGPALAKAGADKLMGGDKGEGGGGVAVAPTVPTPAPTAAPPDPWVVDRESRARAIAERFDR